MNEMIAYCGIHCTQCPTFLATQNEDDREREKVAGMWSKQFKMELQAKDINCDGCLASGGRLFSYCQVCEIRTCCREKGLENCAHCDDYACEKLTAIFGLAPYAKESLEKIRSRL